MRIIDDIGDDLAHLEVVVYRSGRRIVIALNRSGTGCLWRATTNLDAANRSLEDPLVQFIVACINRHDTTEDR